MRRLIPFQLFLVILSAWMLPTAATAQQDPVIEELEIALWPEFDRQAVLVIYRIQLAQETQLPVSLSLPIPSAVGEPHAVAWKVEGGELFLADYTRQEEGEWAQITFQAQGLATQLEFYQEIDTTGASKHFVFVWPGGYAAKNLHYDVQQPVGSSAMNVDPPSDSTTPGAFDLNYLHADLGALAANTKFMIDVSYTKPNDALSVDTVSTGPVLSSIRPEESTPEVAQDFPWVQVGGLVGVLLLFSGFMFIRYRRNHSPIKMRSKAKRRAKKNKLNQQTIYNSLLFCQNCGTKAATADLFCRNCGTKLRRE